MSGSSGSAVAPIADDEHVAGELAQRCTHPPAARRLVPLRSAPSRSREADVRSDAVLVGDRADVGEDLLLLAGTAGSSAGCARTSTSTGGWGCRSRTRDRCARTTSRRPTRCARRSRSRSMPRWSRRTPEADAGEAGADDDDAVVLGVAVASALGALAGVAVRPSTQPSGRGQDRDRPGTNGSSR